MKDKIKQFRNNFFEIIFNDKIKAIMLLTSCSREKAQRQAIEEFKIMEAYVKQSLIDTHNEAVKETLKGNVYTKLRFTEEVDIPKDIKNKIHNEAVRECIKVLPDITGDERARMEAGRVYKDKAKSNITKLLKE